VFHLEVICLYRQPVILSRTGRKSWD
jgi:hypothetical protein